MIGAKLLGTHGLSRKRAVELCQDTWLVTTAFRTGDQKWPSVGSSNFDRLNFLKLILEDHFPAQNDYWYVWGNW